MTTGIGTRRALPAAALVLLLGSWATAQDQALTGRVRERLQPFVDRHELAGVVALAGDRDGVLTTVSLGQRDVKSGNAMTPDTLFRIASMTKPITAAAVLVLADEGKLSVDDPVEKHLPEFRGQMLVASRSGDTVTLKKPSRKITLRDLLTHTSGMPGGPPAGLAELYSKRDRTLAEGVIAYSQRPLEFEPGSKWSYCNAGIDTLGRVVEAVSGRKYEDFLKERFFEPLGMADTTFYPTSDQLARAAMTYDRKDGQLVPVPASVIGPPTGAKYPIPAGGLYSTAPDLAKFYRMLLNKGELNGKRYLSEKAVDEMSKVHTGDLKGGFTPGMGFGLGVGVVKEPQGVTAMLSPGTFGHGGAFGTQGWIDPTRGRFVVLMIQRVGLANGDASDFRKEFQDVVFARP